MMKSYTTSAGAAKAVPACNGGPIVRLLRDPEDIFVPVMDLDVEVHVLTAGSPRGRHEFAGAVKLMDIVDAHIVGQDFRYTWRNLRAIPDADNPNNVRIVGEKAGQVICKVYGFTPEEAEAKANAIMAALAVVLR